MLCALQATATRAYMEPPPRALIWLSSQGYETCAGLDLVDMFCAFMGGSVSPSRLTFSYYASFQIPGQSGNVADGG
jgi:hypothetical protein